MPRAEFEPTIPVFEKSAIGTSCILRLIVKMCDRFLQKRINVNFCVKFGGGGDASDTCAVLSIGSRKLMTNFSIETGGILM
jgi:hypothetical protein